MANNETPWDGNGEGPNVVLLETRRKEEAQRLELESLAADLASRTVLEAAKTNIEYFTSEYLIAGYLLLSNHAKDNLVIKHHLDLARKSINKHPNLNVRVIFEAQIKERRLAQEADKQRRIAEIRANQVNMAFDDYEEDKYAKYDSQTGLPTIDIINAQLAIKHLGVKAKYNLFKEEATCQYNDLPAAPVALFNDIYARTRVQFPIEKLETALATFALRNSYHPIKDYFDSIEDLPSKGFIEKWMTTVFGAEDNPLNCEIGKKMLVAMVARIYDPGVKFDPMVIFEGPQGTGKSTVLELLVGTAYFNSGSLFTEDKPMTQTEALLGIMLYESADLAGHKKADIDKVKAFLSKTNDRGRWVYDRSVRDFKRTAIIVGTTNSPTYLMDETGNRRFWPVKTSVVKTNNIINGKIYADTDWIKQNRNQIWSEALRLYRNGYSLTLDPSLWGEVEKLQIERVVEVAGIERIGSVFGLSEDEGLHIYIDDSKAHVLELRIHTKDIMDNLFHVGIQGRVVKSAMLTYSNLEHDLRWHQKLMKIGRIPPAQGYFMIAEGKEQYDYLKSVIEACREERRKGGIDGTASKF